MRAWGLPTPVKLLPDAVNYFAELSLTRSSLVFERRVGAQRWIPTEISNVERCLSCAPRWLVFLERKEDSPPVIKPVSVWEAASRLVADLETMPPLIFDQYEYQLETIHRLVDRECWVVQHGLKPRPLSLLLAEICGSE